MFLKLIFFLFLLTFVYDNILYFTTKFTKVITVSQKYVAASRTTKYVIVDSENKVYYLTRSYIDGSIDVVQQYAMITTGQKYTVRGYGIDYPALNFYKNVYESKAV